MRYYRRWLPKTLTSIAFRRKTVFFDLSPVKVVKRIGFWGFSTDDYGSIDPAIKYLMQNISYATTVYWRGKPIFFNDKYLAVIGWNGYAFISLMREDNTFEILYPSNPAGEDFQDYSPELNEGMWVPGFNSYMVFNLAPDNTIDVVQTPMLKANDVELYGRSIQELSEGYLVGLSNPLVLGIGAPPPVGAFALIEKEPSNPYQPEIIRYVASTSKLFVNAKRVEDLVYVVATYTDGIGIYRYNYSDFTPVDGVRIRFIDIGEYYRVLYVSNELVIALAPNLRLFFIRLNNLDVEKVYSVPYYRIRGTVNVVDPSTIYVGDPLRSDSTGYWVADLDRGYLRGFICLEETYNNYYIESPLLAVFLPDNNKYFGVGGVNIDDLRYWYWHFLMNDIAIEEEIYGSTFYLKPVSGDMQEETPTVESDTPPTSDATIVYSTPEATDPGQLIHSIVSIPKDIEF